MAVNLTAVCVLPAMVLLRTRNGTAAVFPMRAFYLEAVAGLWEHAPQREQKYRLGGTSSSEGLCAS